VGEHPVVRIQRVPALALLRIREQVRHDGRGEGLWWLVEVPLAHVGDREALPLDRVQDVAHPDEAALAARRLLPALEERSLVDAVDLAVVR
jgi:hypothetical protein